jgi:BirA family transcriptional regulator, biotin operon repressor / biotin---[acetyl-CoA-carboxylase] ligase
MPETPARFRIAALATVDSTNEEARRRAAQGAADGTVVWAERQEAGRGRQGRCWESPAGNLYCSILLRPDCAPAAAAQLAFVTGVAVAAAVAEAVPPARAVTCKWPNDVLVDGRKIAGILVESAAVGGDRVAWVIVGVGLNVTWSPDGGDSLYPGTSLAAAGAPDVDLLSLLARFLGHFANAIDTWTEGGFAPVRTAWLARAHGLGRPLSARFGESRIDGTFLDLDTDGALILDAADGRRRVVAGDVFPGDVIAGDVLPGDVMPGDVLPLGA